MPRVAGEDLAFATWMRRLEPLEMADNAVMTEAELDAHNAAVRRASDSGGYALFALDAPPTDPAVVMVMERRREHIGTQLRDGAWVQTDGTRVSDAIAAQWLAPDAPTPATTVSVLLAPAQVRCLPTPDPLWSDPVSRRYDRNQCSYLGSQEPIAVIGEPRDGMLLVRARHVVGYIEVDTPRVAVTDPVAIAELESGPFASFTQPMQFDRGAATVEVGPWVRLPSRDGAVRVYGPTGAFDVPSDNLPLQPAREDLTRRRVFAAAFAMLDTPYGWGGQNGGRDCSAFVEDVLAAAGVQLPRFSGHQAASGTFSVNLDGIESVEMREYVLDIANEHGVVLLQFPGHIMLYLGRNAEGIPMAIHALGEMAVPCDAPDAETETLFAVDRVVVSDLRVGEGSSRRAFIERLQNVTVIGQPPDARLAGIATQRLAAPLPASRPEACDDSVQWRVVVPDEFPSVGETVRVVAVTDDYTTPRQLVAWGPDGSRTVLATRQYGGPPFGIAAQLPLDTAGNWTVAVGDGLVDTCTTLDVDSRSQRRAAPAHAWDNARSWDPLWESFYSVWVEALFDYPIEEDPVWTNLEAILADADRNLLFNSLGYDEESDLSMAPDCADLPWTLRAYFAWKMGLPYAVRSCSRGRDGRPPSCQAPTSNADNAANGGPVSAFQYFASRVVRDTVHSSSGRTTSVDEATDLYPVPLDETGLRPGVVYADPFGHVLVLTDRTFPTFDAPGILRAVDAQPDATIGLRRFWRGTFLFRTETNSGASGFKAFRPVRWRRGVTTTLDNGQIAEAGYSPWDDSGPSSSSDEFYDALDAYIDPLPRPALETLRTLCDALLESVVRREQAVDTGETWRRTTTSIADMPSGSAIFQTAGPWEDFSTPSRDLRLLIAFDTVTGFPDAVRRRPERFGLDALAAEEVATSLEAALPGLLQARSFTYSRSDGSEWPLDLGIVLGRLEALEMGYNPNDCPEVRWGADPASDEASTCDGRAPTWQIDRMRELRPWFETRERPAR
jgi:cell wall-associated NlpC family hydrolase